MKNFILTVLTVLAMRGLAAASGVPTNATALNPAPTAEATPLPATNAETTVSSNSVSTVATGVTNAPATNAPIATTNAPESIDINDTAGITPTNALRMNFHDAPLKTVLTYLSARMGFVIVSDVDVRGNATIVSEQPVGTNEVLELLNGALAKNNYSVTRNGRILTINTADYAKNGAETPVLQASSPAEIPVNDQIATIVLPVHVLNPAQLIKDLSELIPPGATVTANEAGNAVVMTARQKDIHRFSEIINALDSSSISDIHVWILKYADAKAVAAELKEVFQSPDSSVARSDSRRSRGGFGGFFGGGGPGGDGGGASAEVKNAANKAVFTSDDQRNAVIASAPPDFFKSINDTITNLDQPTDETTVVRTFKLKYADAQETTDELLSLFSDDSKTSSGDQSRSSGFRFFTPPWMSQASSGGGSSESDRMKRQSAVRAVPDLRTASVLVTASKDMMEQIAQMITALDHDPAMTKHIYSFDLDSADPVTVQQTMTTLFGGQNTRNAQTTTTSALEQRVTSAAQQQTQSSSGFGTTGGGGGTAGVR